MSDPKKAASNDEIHGYDALDRLETESFDRAAGPGAGQGKDSGGEQRGGARPVERLRLQPVQGVVAVDLVVGRCLLGLRHAGRTS